MHKEGQAGLERVHRRAGYQTVTRCRGDRSTIAAMQATALSRRRCLQAALGLPSLCRAQDGASTLRVGAGQRFARIADALAEARDGDTVAIAAGDHRGDVAVLLHRRLRIVGMASADGRPPRLIADGRHAEGKAIWVLRNGDFQIENLHFEGARVPDRNGAGIRFERGRLRLRGCSFRDNQNGVLTGNDGDAELDIADCEFADAPPQVGSLPHLLYVGRIKRLTLRHSRFANGFEGHLVKSRARQSLIEHNELDDGPKGRSSYVLDLPNGGDARVAHNRLGQGLRTQNPVMLAYGAEGAAGSTWPESRLLLEHNVFINRLGDRGVPVRVWQDRLPAGTVVTSRGNQWRGGGRIELGAAASSQDDQAGPLPPD